MVYGSAKNTHLTDTSRLYKHFPHTSAVFVACFAFYVHTLGLFSEGFAFGVAV
jgi:hypothetical protein